MSIESIGNELVICAKELVKGKTFKRFDYLNSEKKAEVVAKTVRVAFAAGLLGYMLFGAPVITFVVSGALAFSYFTRDVPGSKEAFDVINMIDKVSKNPEKGAEKLGGKIDKVASAINNAVDSFVRWIEK